MDNKYGSEYSDINWDKAEEEILNEITGHIKNNNIGESLKCINHAVNSHLNRALLFVQGLKIGEYKTAKDKKDALDKIYQNSLKASVMSKQLQKLYRRNP